MRTPFPSRRVLVASLVACLASPAFAADPPRPAVLKVLEAKGATGLQEFKASNDVRAFAGAIGSDPIAVYVLKDGSAVVGTRVDASGEPIDVKTIDGLVAKPMEDAAWRRLESARWIREGHADAPRVVYVFTDANCPWCHRLFEAARPWVAAGKVQLRQLYVGVIRADSGAKAAAIMTAPNPIEAAERNERDFDKGGIAALKTIPAATKATLDANLALMDSMRFRGTPGIVYHGADGRMKTLGGFPQGDQLTDVLGPR
jgi:thiol:disulfide interchange protein DsbG